MANLLLNKVGRFALVGVTSTAVDFVVYCSLLQLPSGSTSLSKGLGFVAGTLTGFVLNRKWTFQHSGAMTTAITRYFVLYTATMFINVSTNEWVISNFDHTLLTNAVGFTLATSLSATINYLAMKMWIFGDKK